MNLRAQAVMAKSGGLLTRSQALDCGMTAREIAADIRAGALVIVRRGVYVDGLVWAELDDHLARPRLRTRAAVATMSRAWVASHDSAAYELRLQILRPPEPHVHITRPGTTGAWTKSGVKHHLAGFEDDQVVDIDGLRVLDAARTAVDIAREHGPPYGEVACDSAMRMGVARSDLRAAVAPMLYWPYSRRTREAIEFADPGAESVAETLGRALVVQALGDEDVETQFPVVLDDGREVRGDIRVGCHIFEVHGKAKYIPESEGGLAERSPTEIAWADKKRERLLHREGLGTSSIFFADYWNPDRAGVLRRMREEYADTVARFGDRLPPRLRANADAIRRAKRGA